VSPPFRTFAIFALAGWSARVGFAADPPTIKNLSPDKRFALRLTPPNGADVSDYKAELVEQSTSKVIVDLGTAYPRHLEETKLVWSANSKWVAYATRGDKEGDTSVYFWNGSDFEEVKLPNELPRPQIQFRKGAGESVKNYGGAVVPVRWLKSGDLELSSDLMMLSRVDNHTYTGVVPFTISFDKQHHAAVHTIGKTKTQVED
jgi:hypothetical protein